MLWCLNKTWTGLVGERWFVGKDLVKARLGDAEVTMLAPVAKQSRLTSSNELMLCLADLDAVGAWSLVATGLLYIFLNLRIDRESYPVLRWYIVRFCIATQTIVPNLCRLALDIISIEILWIAYDVTGDLDLIIVITVSYYWPFLEFSEVASCWALNSTDARAFLKTCEAAHPIFWFPSVVVTFIHVAVETCWSFILNIFPLFLVNFVIS